ncbi:hypothetical protein [Amycolatopsis sp. lyj-108]|uniref:hypothetical protein n=1 Tax=Amycolatopsis sp. lyj-108 TaxID=2789286 RepID=UPI00397C738A
MPGKFKNNWTKPDRSPASMSSFADDPKHVHTLDAGSQITPTIVRWECRCGATRDEYDSPVRHG